MQQGFNEDVEYKGSIYHIQTEDSGIKRTVITTLVFKDGAIVASRRTNYADILKFDKLDMVVRCIMKEQHDRVISELKQGILGKR